MQLYRPLDQFLYPVDPRSRTADGTLQDGLYAYAQDPAGVVWVIPDEPHVHPKILGMGRSALYAGDLSIQAGEVLDVTNLSGTFQCDDPDGLLAAADQLIRQGLMIRAGGVSVTFVVSLGNLSRSVPIDFAG